MRRLCVLLPAHWAAQMGGAEYQAKLLVERLLARGEFEIHYAARTVSPTYRPEGYAIERIPGTRRRMGGTFFPDAPALWRLLKRLDPDVVYQRVGCAYTGVAAHFARTRGRRLVWHVSSDRDVTRMAGGRPLQRLDKLLLEYGARRADAVIVQSRQQKELLRRNYAREATALIGNFHPPAGDVRKDDDVLRVCWIANMKTLKRPELFVRLARDLGARPDVEFCMIGKLPQDPGLRGELEALIAASPVRYLGAQPNEAVNDLLARSHLLVNTSDYEGFSNTFIQAWMREVPVVSLNVNPDGVFDEGKLGFCAGGSYETLRAQVDLCLGDSALREAIGRRAREHAHAHYADGNLDKVIDIIAGV
jgi:glycosyltransferase involved in cell wall biosynthesis